MFDADRELREWLDHLRRIGLISECRVEHISHDATVRFDFILPNRRDYHAVLTHSELRMGGVEELWRWTRHVERGIAHEGERPRHGAVADRPLRYGEEDEYRRQRYEQQRFMQEHMQWEMLRGLAQTPWLGIDPARTEADEKAKKRAADLFKATAGEEAFKALEAGKPWPITGSKGTKYLLHRRASYCVERVSDKARLCAVVPNVPLWDHLLGIKLMVEQDEEKFLKTANVAGGRNVMPGAWVDEAATFQWHQFDALRWLSITQPNGIVRGDFS